MDSLPDFKDLLIVVVLQLKDFWGKAKIESQVRTFWSLPTAE